MVEASSRALDTIIRAFRVTRKTGSLKPRNIITGQMFKGNISPKLGHRAMEGMEKILERKGKYRHPVNGRQMSRAEAAFKADLQMRGIPENTS